MRKTVVKKIRWLAWFKNNEDSRSTLTEVVAGKRYREGGKLKVKYKGIQYQWQGMRAIYQLLKKSYRRHEFKLNK
jgi:hypothetical protein